MIKKHIVSVANELLVELYRCKNGKQIHADINGALNILRKSEVVELPINLKIKNPIKFQVQKRKAVA